MLTLEKAVESISGALLSSNSVVKKNDSTQTQHGTIMM